MIFNRKELKEIKKDIAEQLKGGIAPNDIYIKGMITYGENIHEGRDEKVIFKGNITKKELNVKNNDYKWKIYQRDYLIIEVLEDENIKDKYDIYFTLRILKINEYDIIEEDYITLNI